MRTLRQTLERLHCPPAWRPTGVRRVPWDVNGVASLCENRQLSDFSAYTRAIYHAFGE